MMFLRCSTFLVFEESSKHAVFGILRDHQRIAGNCRDDQQLTGQEKSRGSRVQSQDNSRHIFLDKCANRNR